MTTLREFIAARQSEIADQMSALRKEARELSIALDALDGGKPRANGSAQSDRPTIKEMAVDVLRQYGGARLDSIIGMVKEKHGVDVPRSSMSPQLSRLKNEGVVEFDTVDKLWWLTGNGQLPNENEATTDASEANAGSVDGASGVLPLTQSVTGA